MSKAQNFDMNVGVGFAGGVQTNSNITNNAYNDQSQVPPYGPPQGQQYGPPHGQPYGPPHGQPYVQPGVAMPMPMNPAYNPAMDPHGANQQTWMQRPAQIVGCPPGLEYLTMVDQCLVHQEIELLEVFTNWETKNKYRIKNSLGQQVYYASEESDGCERQCCGPQRGFIMHIVDNLNVEVLRATREFKCCAGPCCSCCANSESCSQVLNVEAPPGQRIGSIVQEASCCEPKFAVKDASEQTILEIRGPVCMCQGPCFTDDIKFKLFTADMSTEIGKICKQWSGYVQERFTNADNFSVSFPLDLSVNIKAVCLAGVFLIDFMYFENKNNHDNNSH